MSIKKTIIASLIALPLAFTSSAFAGGDMAGFGMKKGQPVWLKGITLTAEQQTQLKDIVAKGREGMKTMRDTNKTQNQADSLKLGTLVFADSFDKAGAEATTKSMMERQYKMRLARLEMQHAIVKVLTPEQKTQAQQNMKNIVGKLQTLGKK